MQTSTTRIERALEALHVLDWVGAHLAVGKARRSTPLPLSIFSEDGFLREVLREAAKLKRAVGDTIDSPEVRKKLLASTEIDWRGLSASNRKRAVTETANLLKGLPSDFAGEVRAVLDTEANRIVQLGHGKLGKQHQAFSVNPIFALRNEQAISAINDTTSIFFKPEYEAQADRFRRRAQDTMGRGLGEGLGSKEIGSMLRQEFSELALHPSYWDTVASVHVNRARSFSAIATYAANGITQYEVLAILDERTTPICQMMDGTILGVDAALDSFDAFEDAKNIEEVRSKVPFMRASKDVIRTVNGAVIARLKDGGEWNKIAPGKMNQSGIAAPPYHFRCRSTVVPVIETALAIPSPQPVTQEDAQEGPPPQPPPDKPPRGEKPKLTPENPGSDPVLGASSVEQRQNAVVKQIRDGRGFVPGQFADPRVKDLFGGGAEKREEFMNKIGEEFRKVGRSVIEGDPELKQAWNAMLAARSKRTWDVDRMATEREALVQLERVLGTHGANQIADPAERAKRREKFQDDILSRAKEGEFVNGIGVPKANPRMDDLEREKLSRWAGEIFDTWGPLAEATLPRLPNIFRISGRAYNAEFSGYMTYATRNSFHHEFGHSIENYMIDGTRGTVSRFPSRPDSYWAHRIDSRDPNPAQPLPSVTGNIAYSSSELTKEDRWGDAYMGKVYHHGTTEIVSVFAEFFGGDRSVWRNQFRADPTALEEFVGYLVSATRGERTRRSRDAKPSTSRRRKT